MNINEFVEKNSQVKPNADIVQRWESRVVANNLALRGAAGADAYLGQFGKGMKAPKAVGFARCAEIKGCPEFAARMWEEAFFLETGKRERLGAVEGVAAPLITVQPTLSAGFEQLPQLLVAVDRPTALRYAAAVGYVVQEKVDGVRLIAAVKGASVAAGNKKGLGRAIPLNVADTLKSIGKDMVVDGELVGATYHVFDLLEAGGRDLRAMGFAQRWTQLKALVNGCGSSVKLVDMAESREAKLALIEKLERENREGFVLKKSDAAYVTGDRHGEQWKHQFRGLLAVIAGEQKPGKKSVEMLVNRDDGSRRSLGFLTIPVSAPVPTAGSIVEVEYLYCHSGPNGKLAQPVFKGVRDDVYASDCRESKIKVKADPEIAVEGKASEIEVLPDFELAERVAVSV